MSGTSVRHVVGGGLSLERLRALDGQPRPAGALGLLARYVTDVVLDEPLITADGVALGGHHRVTLHRDGRFRYEGHVRATGWPSYTVSLATRILAGDGTVFTFAAQGAVHGTNEAGDREHSWVMEGSNPMIALHWANLRHASWDHNLQYDVDFFGDVGDVALFVLKWTVAAAVGPVGVIVLLAAEAIDRLNLQELALPATVGLLLTGGVVLILGPGMLIPALIVGVAGGLITAALVHQRTLTDAEYAFADRVFAGTLPRERIRLTNLVGKDDRAFTVPGPGGAILVNLGDGFDDPMGYTGHGGPERNVRAAGQLLIHELTHAWQIAHSHFLPGMMCSAIGNQVGTLGGDMTVYAYGPAGPNFDTFNLEQQGSIVDGWFAGNLARTEGPQRRYVPMLADDANPYWRYLRDHIRAGVA
ncbi:hypothetical protein [Microlunatus ginsengisoli]|uniref:Type IV secretion protein Rhs n=1 Tax=Microlunatus ginsengisoli TaxID=363863 RepID=A0ABP7AEK5_9ACTN